jgi:hypothetical protein
VRTGETSRGVVYPAELGTPSVIRPDQRITQLVEEVFPEGLAGRSFLDCACNAGRSFGFDVRDHWIQQARFLARHLPSENIAFETCDLAALPALGLEPFDVTLFMGIFYRLPDPIAGLRGLSDATRRIVLVWRSSQRGELIRLVTMT